MDGSSYAEGGEAVKTKHLLALNLLWLTGCGWLHDLIHEYRFAQYAHVESYHGMLRESGITGSDDALSTEIWFTKPAHFDSLVKAPANLAGLQLYYDGTVLQFHNPVTKTAVRYTNLTAPSVQDIRKMIESRPLNGKGVEFENGANSKV